MKISVLLKWYALIICLWLARVAYTQTLRTGYLIWNIFLALMPIMLIYAYGKVQHKVSGISRRLVQGMAGALWLLFLPNSFYILTDFMHLNQNVLVNDRGDVAYYAQHYSRGDGMFVFDSLLMFLATGLGAYAGGLALTYAYRKIAKRFSRTVASLGITVLMTLSAVGVYIGRFGRWNSWDAVTHPIALLQDVWSMVASQSSARRLALVVIATCILELVSFYAVSKYATPRTDS